MNEKNVVSDAIACEWKSSALQMQHGIQSYAQSIVATFMMLIGDYMKKEPKKFGKKIKQKQNGSQSIPKSYQSAVSKPRLAST